MRITLYSNGCPKCKILKERLYKQKIEYEEKYDTEFLEQNNIFSFPAMKIDEEIFNFYEAINWLKNKKSGGNQND
jgi:glutaredoxin